MKTEIIGIEFKKGVTEDEIKEFVSNLYLKNKNTIAGMRYYEFDGDEELKKVYGVILSDSNETAMKKKKGTQKKLEPEKTERDSKERIDCGEDPGCEKCPNPCTEIKICEFCTCPLECSSYNRPEVIT